MSTKAPDTRNRIDNQRNVTPRKKKTKIVTKKDLVDVFLEDHTAKISKEKKPTKGELFKKANGYSKTMKRNLAKHDLSSNMIGNYKEIRKARKKIEKKAEQAKHAKSVAFKKLNGKTKGKGKSKNPTGKAK